MNQKEAQERKEKEKERDRKGERNKEKENAKRQRKKREKEKRARKMQAFISTTFANVMNNCGSLTYSVNGKSSQLLQQQ